MPDQKPSSGCALTLLVIHLLVDGPRAATAAPLAGVRPAELRVNFLANSTASTNARRLQTVEADRVPDFSWQLEALGGRGELQVAYHLQVSVDSAFGSLLCDTGRVASNQSLCVQPCNVSAANVGSPIFWRVRAAGKAGVLSAWVDGPTVLRGPTTAEFVGHFVAAPRSISNSTASPVRLRTVVPVPSGDVQSALVYLASPGYYHLWSGGVRLNADTEYGPWPEFVQRVYYDSWNVTDLFRNASSHDGGDKSVAFGLRIGPGTYGHTGAQNFARTYNASALPLLFELHIQSKSHDGGGIVRQRMASFSSSSSGGVDGRSTVPQPLNFNTHADPILTSDWYQGERVDNTLSAELDGWDTVAYSESGKSWLPAVEYTALTGRALTPTLLEPVTRHGSAPLKPSKFISHGGGQFAWHFDQNFGGYAELDVPAAGFANTTLTVTVGEEVDANGLPTNGRATGWWENDGTLHWTLRGKQKETIRQTFMFMGFQYIGVVGWPDSMPLPTISSMRGVPTSTLSADRHQVGKLTFDGMTPSASIAAGYRARGTTTAAAQLPSPPTAAPPATSTKLNATILAGVYHLTIWGQVSNLQSIPSDCPNREKHGWMGDAANSAMQAAANFDMAAIYRSWVRSMLDNQAVNARNSPSKLFGAVNSIVPPGDWSINTADASWGEAIAEIPYQSLKQYGDVTLMRGAYGGIRAYWEFLKNQSDAKTGLLLGQAQWGDWDAAFSRTFYQPNTMHIGATSAHMQLAQILEEVAPLVGRPQDVAGYTAFLQKSKPAFNSYYQNKTTPFLYVDGVEQTVTLLPLSLGFLPTSKLEAQAQAWLINDIETTRGMHLSTGATGTRILFPYLSTIGRTDLAAQLAAQSTFPSHGYWVTQGATTAWENWSGKPDDQHGNAQPTHNHIFLASQGGWMYERLLGIRQPVGSYGYERVLITPPLIDSLASMAGTIDSVRGTIASSWAWTGGAMKGLFALNCTIPPNVHATVTIPVPGLASPTITEGGQVVWKDGHSTGGVSGITGAHAANDATVVFTVGSGSYNFASAAASDVAAAAAAESLMTVSNCGGGTLRCPRGSIGRIICAGLVAAADKSSFESVPVPMQSRYLAAHLLEHACVGVGQCKLRPIAAEIATVRGKSVGGVFLCAKAVCQ